MGARKRVAIVGSGCSGLAALWALKNTDHEVHLYEAKDRIGGHTNTVSFNHDGKSTSVDTGFIVMNTATYPNFIKFLRHINVPPADTLMTFGVSRDHGDFEWAGTSLSSIFAQRSNLFSARFWLMIFDIVRFNQFALDVLRDAPESKVDPSGSSKLKGGTGPSQHLESIGSYLDREGYSEGFINDYLIPMTAAVWSTSPGRAALEFPAITLIRFLWNHHLLSTLAARPSWMTIKGGSKRYIDVILKDFPEDQIHLEHAVKKVDNHDGDVQLTFADGSTQSFHHVIIATHGDTAAELVRDGATRTEREIMDNFHTSENVAVLHSDRSLMPQLESTWSSWNYLTRTSASGGGDVDTVCLTYWMNLLQHIPSGTYGDIFVTLNPLHWPQRDTVQGSWTYHHPQYTSAAIWAQEQLPRIQNTRGISYCGAWTKYGFHEDGFSSGLKVAMEHLDAELPFDFVDSTFSRGKRPLLGWQDQVARIVILIVHIALLVSSGLVRTLGLGKWYRGSGGEDGQALKTKSKPKSKRP